jgi:hypothetical protein
MLLRTISEFLCLALHTAVTKFAVPQPANMRDPVDEWLGSVRDLDALLKTTQQQTGDVVYRKQLSVADRVQRLHEAPPLPQKTWRCLVLQEKVRHTHSAHTLAPARLQIHSSDVAHVG